MKKVTLENLAAERSEDTSEIFTPNNFYGHASLLKKYCGINQNFSLPGIYPHGITIRDNAWSAELAHPIPFLLLKSNLQSDVYSKYCDKPSWIIGAPNYYATRLLENELKEIQSDAKGTLVFPVHSTHHLNNSYNFDEFAEYLKNLPEQFRPVKICLGWRDIQLKMHERYLARDFECATAGHMYDKEFFFRLMRIIASHKFAITNHLGTSSFYCAAMNLPVLIYRQAIQTDPARSDQPAHLFQEAQLKPYLPIVEEFLAACKNPDAHMVQQQKDIAKLILGYDYIKEPEELCSLFESLWKRSEMKPFIKRPNYVAEGSLNKVIEEIGRKVGSYPRQTPGELKIDGIPFIFADLHSFYHQAIQIFKFGLYGFKADNDNPVILDCGAHVGLASIYFATKYPNSQIHSFEADPAIAQMLAENIKSFGLTMVNVHPHAVWINEQGVSFNKSGDDSGFIGDEDLANLEKVPSIRLKQIIENQHVDLLKLDIEGAEYDVIKDCDEALANVKNIIIEVHKFRDHNGSLGDILGILEKHHFEYTFGDLHSADWLEPSLIPPFFACKTNKYTITIFAWQTENRKVNAIETEKYLEKAIHELNSKETSRAIHFIEKALRNNPEEKSLYYPLSVAHARKNNFFEAQRLLARIPKDNHIFAKASLLREAIDARISDLTYLASYPRSGNTWMRYLIADIMLQQMGYQTDTKLPFPAAAIIPDMHLPNETDIALSPPVHLIKTHNEYSEQQEKVLYLFRNPADSLVSYYYFHLRYPDQKAMVSDGVDAFCLRKIEAWCRHIHSYIKATEKMEKRIMFVSYENMHNGLSSILERVLNFINLPFDNSIVERAVNNHTFKKHHANENIGKKFFNNFFRKGECGYGDKELSENVLENVYQKAMPLYRQAKKIEERQTNRVGE
jgi:FkbM family methyltransferase